MTLFPRFTADDDAPQVHGRRVLIGVLGAIGLGMAAMVALGRYAFIWKSAVVPILLLAAVLARRPGRFVDDWGIFLALVILFDFLRGFVFAAITHWQLPVYMNYAIAAERWLCGGHVMPVLFQQWRTELPWKDVVDRALIVVHSSHFVFFLCFGLAVWLLRREHFYRFAAAVVVLMYLGALLYLLVPTVPPWMAADDFGVLPPLEHISAHLYNTKLPALQEAFDVNPIAAMPSLHAALPSLCALFAAELFGVAAVLIAFYVGFVYLAIMYLGEHYLVDVLAGLLLAIGVFGLTRRLPSLARWMPRALPVRPVMLTALLIVAAEGLGQLTLTLRGPFEVTPAFAERELAGRTFLAHLYLGRFALERGDLVTARRELEQAAVRIEKRARRQEAVRWLARTAYLQGDYETVIATLAPRRDDADLEAMILLARAFLDSTQTDAGEALLRRLVARYPREPEPLYWLMRHDYQQRRLSGDDVRRAIERLEILEHEADTDQFSTSLLALVRR